METLRILVIGTILKKTRSFLTLLVLFTNKVSSTGRNPGTINVMAGMCWLEIWRRVLPKSGNREQFTLISSCSLSRRTLTLIGFGSYFSNSPREVIFVLRFHCLYKTTYVERQDVWGTHLHSICSLLYHVPKMIQSPFGTLCFHVKLHESSVSSCRNHIWG